MKLKSISRVLFAAALSFAASTAFAAFPEQPIRLTVGFPAGTGPDIVARTVGDQMSQELGQPVVVENKAGAGGQIAAYSVARGTPNGYNILLGEVGSISISPETTANLSYKPIEEFEPITEAVRTNFVLVTPADSPYKTLAEFVKAAKESTDEFNIATFGAGTPGHFGAEMLAEAGGFKIVPIHYRSTGDAVTAIMSGQVQGAFVTTSMAAPQLAGGKMGALAITGAERAKMLSQVPTFKELGMPDVDFGAWFAFFAPKGTPDAALNVLNEKTIAALQAEKVRKVLEDSGFVIVGSSREDLSSLLVSEQRRWSEVVKKTGFKIN
ncbi:Bug family tripartite tricarboxylate transporter substrate binding protein [Pollutimonas thiosulfatoxidans]|uniref:C4-dicarboxylate ABC transporter n=1 Tax=Pollutimonas thiosulfatoxidans TaxID=2028345 RepID=A0A410GA01_9BURK|nr:tripartite tricarboxylate transporter substrate binding protein [Pollutimonas thiosulfatoxidans]MBF6617918.1 tripartite tricarboxylate transporter substrate binding protein [Candidimonas sp.]NYT44934.1 tripartite tricarboxylate transporter substrate binding protein [Alcaligenaceae bacterium]QAA93138.1 C4-dicarboxylate ABC transporter [Pollutimonas thiosulfatoxidans]